MSGNLSSHSSPSRAPFKRPQIANAAIVSPGNRSRLGQIHLAHFCFRAGHRCLFAGFNFRRRIKSGERGNRMGSSSSSFPQSSQVIREISRSQIKGYQRVVWLSDLNVASVRSTGQKNLKEQRGLNDAKKTGGRNVRSVQFLTSISFHDFLSSSSAISFPLPRDSGRL